MKKTLFVLYQVLVMAQAVHSQKADAGPDAVNYQQKGVTIGTPRFTDPNWCYKWTADPADASLTDPTTAQPTVNPAVKTTYTLTLSYKNGNQPITQDAVDVYVLESAKFKKNDNQKYGYDDGEYRSGPTAGQRWKSVETGSFDVLDIDVYPVTAAKFIKIKSNDGSKINVSPTGLSASPQKLQVSGVSKGETSIQAFYNDGTREVLLDLLNVVAYNAVSKTVAVRLVHEQNDDRQVIGFVPKKNPATGLPITDPVTGLPVLDKNNPRGKPHITAVTAGADGVLNTLFPQGDDKIVGNEIETGDDGICQTLALSNDVQVIAPGKGAPFAICINPGANRVLDTKQGGDDEWIYDPASDMLFITTGANGIVETVANNMAVQSRDFSTTKILSYLNKAYGQAAVKWQVILLPAVTVNCDLDNDGKVDIEDGGELTVFGHPTGIYPSQSDERKTIINKCKDDNYDYNVFLIDRIKNDEEANLEGNGAFGQKYVFISVKNVLESGVNHTVENTVAHELGHAAFRLRHPKGISECGAEDETSDYDGDPKNIMDYCNGERFRKFQWNVINP